MAVLRRSSRWLRALRGLAVVSAVGLTLPTSGRAGVREDARKAYLEGLEAAKAGQYEVALERFLEANALLPHPNVTFNIARAYADSGNTAAAIRWYRRFAEQVPEHTERVDQIIQGLQAAATPAPAPEPEAADTIEDYAHADAYQSVVVSASRHAQSPLDSPASITTLDRSTIRQSGATNLPDLLRRVVGVDVISLSAAQPDLAIRGFNREMSNKVLVLVDGRTVYLDVWGTALWGALTISLEEVERVEIIRGPGGATYGANAVTGVINIITRAPGTEVRLVQVESGSPGYAKQTVLVSGREDHTAYRFSAGHHRTGRWSKEADAPEALIPVDEDPDVALTVLKASGRLDRSVGDAGLASISAGYSGGTTHFYPWGSLGRYALPFDNGHLRFDLGTRRLHLRAFANHLAARGPLPTFVDARGLDTELVSSVVDVELQANGEATTGSVDHRFDAAVSTRYKAVSWGYLEGDGERITELHAGVFAQDELTMGSVAAIGSLRVDRHPLVPFRAATSPRLAMVWHASDTSAGRVSASSAFRTPNFMESYLDFEQSTGSDAVYVRNAGTRTLLPERLSSVEVGWRDESSDVHAVDAVVYVARLNQEIFITDLEPQVAAYSAESGGFAAGTTSFTNLTEQHNATGAELDLRVFPVKGLDLFGNVAWERVMTVDTTVDRARRDPITNGTTPTWMANLGVAVRTPWRIDASSTVHLRSARVWSLPGFDARGQAITSAHELPAATLLTARLAARPFAEEDLELAMAAWNIGALVSGEGTPDHPKGQAVGGRLFGTVTYAF